MRSKRNQAIINKIDEYLSSRNPPVNELLYSLIQVTNGFYEPVEKENSIVYEATNAISKEHAQLFFNTTHKDEFVKAYRKKYPNQFTEWEQEQTSFNQQAYKGFCKQLGVKP